MHRSFRMPFVLYKTISLECSLRYCQRIYIKIYVFSSDLALIKITSNFNVSSFDAWKTYTKRNEGLNEHLYQIFTILNIRREKGKKKEKKKEYNDIIMKNDLKKKTNEIIYILLLIFTFYTDIDE